MESYPIKAVFRPQRNTVEPSSMTAERVFHYSLPVWHETGDGQIEDPSELASLKLLLEGGEILVSKLNPEKGAVVLAAKHELPVIGSTEFIAFKPRLADVRFGFWLMQSAPVRFQLEASVESVTNSHKRARVDKFLASRVWVPDLPTQRRIASFLDCETARIDELVAKKKRLVETLKLRRLGKIMEMTSPESYITQPLHRLYWVQTGKTPSRSDERNFDDVNGMPWATPADLLEDDAITATKEGISKVGLREMKPVPKGTVLVNGIGAGVGKVGLAGATMVFNQQIHGLVPKGSHHIESYLMYAMIARRAEMLTLANLNTIPILNGERLGRVELPIPDPETQNRVVHLLNKEGIEQRAISVATATSIDRLREYRAALITAAVIGQIDVETYGKAGNTSAILDRIEEEMQA